MSKGETSLSFLMNRERPKVPPRGDALFTSDRGVDNTADDTEDLAGTKQRRDTEQGLNRASVEHELAAIPATTGIHLKVQPEPLRELQSHLSTVDTTREVWIESAIAVAMQHPEFRRTVDQEAIERYAMRKDWKKRKQALTRLLNTL